MKTLVSLLLIQFFLFTTAGAQSGVAPPNAARSVQQSQSRAVTLTNQDVQELVQAGLTTEELLAKFKSAVCDFDISPDGVRALKKAGVSGEVVAEMVQAQKVSAKNEPSNPPQPDKTEQIVIPAGMPIEIEAASTVDSFQVQSGELLSFRVLVPVRVDGLTVIDKDALVTASVVEAKRGGHWGRAGRLSWTMQDVIAVDGTRIPVQAEYVARSKEQNPPNVGSPGAGGSHQDKSANRVKGDSHSGEIAAHTAMMSALLVPIFPVAPFLAPIILMHGFKRGENAILPAHKRFVVFISSDASVKLITGH